MKRFWAFVWKEILHISRDKRTLMILFGMPAIQILLFGYALTNEIKNAPIAVLDHSKDYDTRNILNKLLSSGYYKMEGELKNENEIESVFKKGRVKQVIIFEENFADNLRSACKANVHIIADASDPNTANTLINYTSSIIMNYNAGQLQNSNMLINIETRMLFNESLKGTFLFVPGLILIILMLVSAMMTSISLTKEKETGTMEVLLVSPVKPAMIIVAKVVPYIALAFADALMILALGNFVFEVPVRGSLVLLLSESLLFIMVALSLGVMISTIAKTQQVALMISLMGLMMPTILLSGFIFPIANMPVWLQTITYALPPRYFNVIVKDIMLKGADLHLIWRETLILMGFVCLFILISTKKFKVRL